MTAAPERTWQMEKPELLSIRSTLVFNITSFLLATLSVSILVHVYFGFHPEMYAYACLASGAFIYRQVLRYSVKVDGCEQAGHFHKDGKGMFVRCYHQCKNLLSQPAFWVGMTLGYPFEHIFWIKLWPMSIISAALGLD